MYYFLTFIGGMIVMDLMWAWKLGLIQSLFASKDLTEYDDEF